MVAGPSGGGWLVPRPRFILNALKRREKARTDLDITLARSGLFIATERAPRSRAPVPRSRPEEVVTGPPESPAERDSATGWSG